MKHYFLGLAVIGAATTSAHAGAWKFKPSIYARGGITTDADFSRSTSSGKSSAWNLGPWNEESNLFSDPLTEVTLEAEYGDQFKFTYGVDVEGNDRNYESYGTSARTPVNERMAYLTYYFGDNSLWVGSRPYRSDAEYLSRAFNFDNKNIYGGGIRFERIGPTNIEFAYGSFENSYQDGNAVNNQEHTNIVINKVEVPLDNGRIRTNLEVQQTVRTSADGSNDDRTHGYLAGVSYQRWGDTVLGGGLYNQFLFHYSKGYVQQTAMGTAFNDFDLDNAAHKHLVQWNGDWKKGNYGFYWVAMLQEHFGKDSSGTYSEDEMKWSFADLMIRPQYGVTSNLTAGAEYARRSVLEEGEGLTGKDWAKNTGSTRWNVFLNYNLDNSVFNNPVITLAYGEIQKDKEASFFGTKTAKGTHFFRLNYEININ